MFLRFIGIVSVAILAQHVSGQVVINEVFYHSPDDIDRLEWIELTNAGSTVVDISSWTLGGGLEYTIPKATVIEPGNFLVICRDVSLFREFYDVPALGAFKKSLGNSGDTIELRNGSNIVDAITYTDRAPWPVAADGYGASLERIVPTASHEPANWASSSIPEVAGIPGGTPGQQNDRYSKVPLPRISNVRVTPEWPTPGESISVACVAKSDASVRNAEVIYQTVRRGQASEEIAVPMSRNADGEYGGVIPGQDAGVLMRIRIKVSDGRAVGSFPTPDLRPAMSVYVMDELSPATIPLAFVVNSDPKTSSVLRQASRSSGPGMQSRMMRARVDMMVRSAFALEDAWSRLMADDDLSHETYLELRDLFSEQTPKFEQLAEEVSKIKDMGSAMQQLPKLAQKARAQFERRLREVLPAEKYAVHEKASPASQEDQFIKQIVPLESLWLEIGTQFENTDDERQQIRAAMAKAVEERKQQLVPLLQKLQTGKAGFEEVQAAAGDVESVMWTTLKPVLSFRQNRFAHQWYSKNTSMMGMGGGARMSPTPRGTSALVHVDTSTGKKKLFDFVNIQPRSAGFKIRFHKDRMLNGMSTVNVIFETNERFVLAEPLAFDLYRRVGTPACLADFVRLHVDGDVIGYHLLFEQPNREFLRRNGRKASGDLYKLIWYGKGIEGRYEKKTQSDTGHAHLLDVIEELESTRGQEQWAVIQKRFNVEVMINYFAVNMCLSHWDGFFNNFFAYHDVQGNGKWELYPWDQDKTWGFHDGIGPGNVFVDLPLTFGMEGDSPPGGKTQMFGQSWWRPGGEFSKPLLANVEFRKRFLLRLKTILTETYNEEVFFPIIDRLAERLRPEVAVRAKALGEDPDQAGQLLEKNVGLLKEHLVKRRAFLLSQAELTTVSP